jgi:hypothetical protein
MWGFSEMLIWPLSLITSNWRYFIIFFILIPTFLSNFSSLYLLETPKFLY